MQESNLGFSLLKWSIIRAINQWTHRQEIFFISLFFSHSLSNEPQISCGFCNRPDISINHLGFIIFILFNKFYGLQSLTFVFDYICTRLWPSFVTPAPRSSEVAPFPSVTFSPPPLLGGEAELLFGWVNASLLSFLTSYSEMVDESNISLVHSPDAIGIFFGIWFCFKTHGKRTSVPTLGYSSPRCLGKMVIVNRFWMQQRIAGFFFTAIRQTPDMWAR